MNLYLDEDSAKRSLAGRLAQAGHRVTIPADAGTVGVSDARHLTYTAHHGLVLVTRNHDDFLDLHLLVQETKRHHPGIIVIRFDNDPNRDMKDHHIVRAINKLERSGASIANDLHNLNHWR